MQTNKQLTYSEVTLASLSQIANDLLKQYSHKIWLFIGEMGAGKTTCIKSLCTSLQVIDSMSSPTFSIVNEYKTQEGKPVYHFDFYRIKNQQEAFDIGVEEYFYSGNYCFIEWPERIPDLLPEAFIKVSLSIINENLRTIQIEQHG